MKLFEEIISKIEQCSKIAILYHVNADGDAIGSSLALYLGFRSKNKTIDIYGEEKVQDQLTFLPQIDKINCDYVNPTQYDLVIVLDAGDLKRLGRRIEIYNNAEYTINIDHHTSNDISSDINYVDTKASATGEIVYDILKTANKNIDEDISTCIYTAIISDTGNFKHSNTTSKTHNIAANLIDNGINHNKINRLVFENEKYSMLKLLGKILNTMQISEDNKITILSTTNEEIYELGISAEEVSNVANYGLSVKDVELSIFFRQENSMLTKISLRSKNTFDCANLARTFNGGGHSRAAGCSIEEPVDKAIEIILKKVREIGI